MLAMLIDYAQYRLRIGRYGPKHLSGAFEKDGLAELWPRIRTGDVLFVFTPGSVLSWLVMYMTDEPFSHCSIYCGHKKVAHMTTSGFSIDSTEIFLKADCKVVPLLLPQDGDLGESLTQFLGRYSREPYGWGTVIGKGVRIFFGRDWPRFKLRFAFDTLSTLFVLDLCTYLLSGEVFFYWLAVPYGAFLARNICSYKKRGNEHDSTTGMQIYAALREAGAKQLFDFRDLKNEDMPAVVATDTYVFLSETDVSWSNDVDKSLAVFGAHVSLPSVPPVGETDFECSCHFQGVVGKIRIILTSYQAVADIAGYPSSTKFSKALRVTSSFDSSNAICAVAFACAFADVNSGVIYNPGLRMSVLPTAAVDIGLAIIESLSDATDRSGAKEKRDKRAESI